jgi:hypothetical protein
MKLYEKVIIGSLVAYNTAISAPLVLIRFFALTIVFAPLYLIFNKGEIKLYIKNAFIGWDQDINTIFGGSPDETLSSRIGRYEGTNWLAKICAKVINAIFGKDHCALQLERPETHVEEVIE